jgi:hypothetical protein
LVLKAHSLIQRQNGGRRLEYEKELASRQVCFSRAEGASAYVHLFWALEPASYFNASFASSDFSRIQNQERVWKAEQKDKVEKDRIAQLIREREEERQKEEMQMIAIKSGHAKAAHRLEWMYAGPVCVMPLPPKELRTQGQAGQSCHQVPR